MPKTKKSERKKTFRNILVIYQTKVKSLNAGRIPHEKYDTIDMKTDFEKDLALDSLDKVEILMAIEEICGGEISDDDAKKFKTFGDLCTYVLNNYKEDAIYNLDSEDPKDHFNKKLINEISDTFQIPSEKLNDYESMSDLIKEVLSLVENNN